MGPKAENQNYGDDATRIVCGLFTKREAAHLIANGTQHLHSSTLAGRDAAARITADSIDQQRVPIYPWEQVEPKSNFQVTSSAERYDFIRDILSRQGVSSRRDLKERIETATEELLTNAIYHAYHNTDGSPRYVRRQSVTLPPAEAVDLQFAQSQEGSLLVVTDKGGSLQFDKLAQCFSRCYGAGPNQIENKEGGAGLGIYMVFEIVTHMKIVSNPGVNTSVSCWIAAPGTFDPDIFSFNFFIRR